MKKFRFACVGLGHRGREMTKLASVFDCVEVAACCDIKPSNWYETQWLSDKPLSEMFPDAKFYESYDEMLEKEQLDIVMVETGADIHAAFCIKALEKNINVLTDIPVVASLKEAEDLWKAAEKSTAVISVGANPNAGRFSASTFSRATSFSASLPTMRALYLSPLYMVMFISRPFSSACWTT